MRHAIVIGSNERSKLTYASMEAVIRTSLGDEVTIFFTMDAVKALSRVPEVTDSFESSKLLRESGEDYLVLLRKAKASGRVRVYACSTATRLFHLKREDYQDLVDDVVGITSFVTEVEGQVTSIW